MVQIRTETEADRASVHEVNESAFETAAEANLVDMLREQASQVISLVACIQTEIVGHIMLSPVELSGHQGLKIMGLAPMAVTPEHQRKGIGTKLVRAGLKECEMLGIGAVAVLGHPEFYPRFGFIPSSRFGIVSEYEVPEEVFMIRELEAGYLNGLSGTIKYHTAFSNV